MKIVSFPLTSEFSTKSKVIALGKFESLHKGHKRLLSEAKAQAQENDHDFVIMIFSQRPANNILSLDERLKFLNAFSPDFIWVFSPTSNNLEVTKEEFEELLNEINTDRVVVGSDFRYGHKRLGDVLSLKEKFKVSILDKDNASTSKVVDSIINGDFIEFRKLMDYYFFYEGEVEKGLGNGKKFGMPTANVKYPKDKIPVPEGIYYSYVIYDNQRLPSLTSVSSNPTLNAEEVTYETYIYNFDKDIYGEEIFVEIIEKFRDPIKFESIDKLIEQLEEDKETGKKYFKL